MNTSRRSFLFGLGASLAAPAIVPYARLMPVQVPKLIYPAGTIGLFDVNGNLLGHTQEIPLISYIPGVAMANMTFRAVRNGVVSHVSKIEKPNDMLFGWSDREKFLWAGDTINVSVTVGSD
jgi:uncharacterized protein (UPF0261 family)